MFRKLLRLLLKLLPRAERSPGKNEYVLNITSSPVDQRDSEYAVTVTEDTLPETALFSHHAPKVKSQGRIGSCGSHAYATAMETAVAMNRGKAKVVPLSERFHYWIVRQPDFMNTYPADSGQYLRDGAKVCKTVGVAPEKTCPYDTKRYNEKPHGFAFGFAGMFRVTTYHRCWAVNSIKLALSKRTPVVFGIRVTDKFIYKTPTSGDSDFGGVMKGGHALCALGYADTHKNPDGTLGAVYFQNSWGASWGRRGYGWISYDDLRKNLIEAWAIALEGWTWQ